MRRHMMALVSLVAVTLMNATVASAVTIDLVPVGNGGNDGEWSGSSYGGYGPDRICGAVDHNYQIGKFEVTAGQYTEFLNAKATVADTYGLYNTDMWSNAYGCKIARSGSGSVPEPYVYSVAGGYANRPVNYVSFWDAARFTNWLNNGQLDGDTEMGSYTLNGYTGYDGRSITRNARATWFLPSEDEWYKAAYHDEGAGLAAEYFDYPTGTNTVPGRDMSESSNPGNNANYYPGNNANYPGYPWPIDEPYYTTLVGEFQLSDSPYGTFDQGGNVWEWNEAVVYEWEGSSSRGMRGGSFRFSSFDSNLLAALLAASERYSYYPPLEFDYIGFRVASVPEPGGMALVVCGAIAAWGLWRRRKQNPLSSCSPALSLWEKVTATKSGDTKSGEAGKHNA